MHDLYSEELFFQPVLVLIGEAALGRLKKLPCSVAVQPQQSGRVVYGMVEQYKEQA